MLLRDMAARIAAFSLADCPSEIRSVATLAVLDTLGVTLAGAWSEAATAVVRALGPAMAPGAALLFGTDRRVDVFSAALANGTASHALDFDDCSNTLGGHPSAPVVPALWALAEDLHADGRRFLEAYLVGFEVETKIGRAVNFHHYEKGWHPTATLGTFGSAAACARLRGLDGERTAAALALAASMASGIKANFGTMAKPYHVGHCSRNGLLAAALAAEGMTANPGALEHPQGFFAVFNGAGNFDADQLFAHWAAPLDIVEPGVAFKRHPCCGSTHPAIDALLTLRERHALRADEVASIESWTHPRRLRHTNRPDPQSGLDGKFSVQYVLARALLHGIVSLDHFTDEAVNEPAVRAVMRRVQAAPDPDATMATTEHFYARIRVTLKSGAQFEAFVDRPLGRDRDHPLPPGTLEAKFDDCAGQVLGADGAARARAAILGLEASPDIAALSVHLAQVARDRPARQAAPSAPDGVAA